MTKAVSQITKTWTNPYNSKMTLQATGGVLQGQYASTAGSTGVYQVYGYIDPDTDAVTPGNPGVPVGLVLNWRSIHSGDKPDPSWNYVSGIGGQLICNDAGVPVLNVNHALIASNPLPGAIDKAGFYVDRLEYDLATAQDDDTAYQDQPKLDDPPEDAVAQATLVYVDEQDPTTRLLLSGKPDSSGFWAAFEWNGAATTLIGTCNTGYSSTIEPYQSIAFCGTVMPGAALSLSGWLDHSNNTISLQSYWVGPQTWPLRFFQSRGRTLVMRAE